MYSTLYMGDNMTPFNMFLCTLDLRKAKNTFVRLFSAWVAHLTWLSHQAYEPGPRWSKKGSGLLQYSRRNPRFPSGSSDRAPASGTSCGCCEAGRRALLQPRWFLESAIGAVDPLFSSLSS